MPEQDELTFPKKMYNDVQDVIEVDCQATLDLAISRGWKRVPPALNTIPKLKAKIAEVEAELKELKENLASKVHETEVAMQAEKILEKMQSEKSAKDAEAKKLAEDQAAQAELDAEEKAKADAKKLAEAQVAVSEGAPAPAPAPAGLQSPSLSPASKIADHLKGKK
jgi:membrane protein involved in colicin uptake